MIPLHQIISVAQNVWGIAQQVHEMPTIEAVQKEIKEYNGRLPDDILLKALTAHDQATGSETLPHSVEGAVTAMCLYRWAESGYPYIEMGEKFAASLLVSNISDEILPTIQMPWYGLCIGVPGDLLPFWDPMTKTNVPARRIFVSKHLGRGTKELENKHLGGDWQFIAFPGDMQFSVWRFGVTPEGLVASKHKMSEEDVFVEETVETTEMDDRATTLCGRLILSACVALTMPGMCTEPQARKIKAKKKKKRDGKEPPKIRRYVLGKPIVHDFRPRIHQFLTGERKTPRELSVQQLVSGHFRNQPYGPGRTLRRVQWIEPFWRGPEDAALPLRPHVLKG